MPSPSPSPPQQTLDLTTLSSAQLSSLKKSLDSDIETLQSSFTKLRAAQTKFKDCVKCLHDGPWMRGATKELLPSKDQTASEKLAASGGEQGEEEVILVPLTNSLYVPGMLDKGKGKNGVLVDVGTGFFVEKTGKDAVAFYMEKVSELDGNLVELDKILQGKAGNLRVVEEVLREKVMAERSAAAAAAPS